MYSYNGNYPHICKFFLLFKHKLLVKYRIAAFNLYIDDVTRQYNQKLFQIPKENELIIAQVDTSTHDHVPMII